MCVAFTLAGTIHTVSVTDEAAGVVQSPGAAVLTAATFVQRDP